MNTEVMLHNDFEFSSQPVNDGSLNYVHLSNDDLVLINGGTGIISEIGGFISNTWNTLYQTGRDFGRSIVNAVMR